PHPRYPPLSPTRRSSDLWSAASSRRLRAHSSPVVRMWLINSRYDVMLVSPDAMTAGVARPDDARGPGGTRRNPLCCNDLLPQTAAVARGGWTAGPTAELAGD